MITCLRHRIATRLLGLAPSRDHLERCADCRQLLAPDLLLDRLWREYGESERSTDPLPSADLYYKIRLRIAERRNEAANSSWEVAVLRFQRAILTGTATAMIVVGLMAYAESRTEPQVAQRETGLESFIGPTTGDRMIITRNEPLSQDNVLFALVTEDGEDARN